MRTPAQLEVADEINKLLTQAGAITGLLIDVRADDYVTNSAWLLSDMLQRVQVLIKESERLAEETTLDE